MAADDTRPLCSAVTRFLPPKFITRSASAAANDDFAAAPASLPAAATCEALISAAGNNGYYCISRNSFP